MRVISQVGEWFDRRLQLAAAIRETTEHPVPRSTASWFYVFGSAALVVFMLQVVTGILLAIVYVPSAAEAWNSLQVLNHDITLGWFIRALHGWGSNFMVAIVLIHMVQVFLFGSYKFPRELTWIVGVFLLLMTLGMAKKKDLHHVNQNDRHHEVRTPPVQRADEPAQRDVVIQHLQAVPRFGRGRNVNDRQQNPGDHLQHENHHRRAADNIEPTTGASPDGRLRGFANSRPPL